ncbi:hypothetical protein SAMN05216390_11380 [Lachnospiraceae bacterium KH1T2]|nr:hypothetical protein SAMN05216390_11380 [Lachnospiraceae bacterium KH1T2]
MKSSKRQVEEYEKKYGIKMDILTELCGKCYVLDLNGDYNYTECFGKADSEYIKQQNYQLIYPEIIIKFYSYYIVTAKGEHDIWYRGTKNGVNYEFDCYADTLEEIMNSL